MRSYGMRRTLALLHTAIFALGLGGWAQISAANEQTPEKTATQSNVAIERAVSINGVPNFGEVTPTLYRGAQPTQEGFLNLARMGVDIVVDLRVRHRKQEREEVTKLGMRYVEIPWQCFNPKDSDMARFLALLRDSPGKKVFVHCYTGDDRTGMEIAAYRMAEEGWTAQQARAEMEAFGFNFVHRRVCPRLGAYETNFPHQFAISPAFQDLRGQAGPPHQ